MDKYKKKLRKTFSSVKKRCYDKNYKEYKYWGGKGIFVEWLDFEEFYNDMSEEYAEHAGKHEEKYTTLDRIDGSVNYSTANCRWTTPKIQSNNKSNNIYITYEGVTMTLQQWADLLKIKRTTLKQRFKLGWSVKDALTKPVINQKFYITHRGETKCIAEWACELGMTSKLLRTRLKRGWPVERAFYEPVQKKTL